MNLIIHPDPRVQAAVDSLDVRIAQLILEPNDILLVKASTDFNIQALDHFATMLRNFIPSKRFIIYTSDMEFTVVKDLTGIMVGWQGASKC